MVSKQEFNLEQYVKLIQIIRKSNYRFAKFGVDSDKKGIIFLRHDIDKNMECAVKMARIEKDLGVHAHYFFLIHSPMYNIMEKSTWEHIYEIHESGHTIGLHFDRKMTPNSNGDLDKIVMQDLEWMQSIFDFAEPIVSFHNPTEISINKKPSTQYINTYSPEYFLPYTKYISDSNRRFRENNLFEKFENKKWPRVQILIHPVWWLGNGETAEEILENVVVNRINKLNSYLKYTNDIWKDSNKEIKN